MVLFRLVERSIGLITTLVLARLLVPADFGIVAMATAVIAVLDFLTGFSFDVALIQKQNVERRHYDAAWTLNVLTYGLMAAVMALVAAPVAVYFREPRVEWALYALGVGVFITGFENIGIVAFRKELMLHKEFAFLIAKKLSAAVVGILVAVIFQTFWALIAGMVAARILGVILSYFIHPFRPRFAIAGARELMHFSKWLFAYSLVAALAFRLPDFIIGRLAGPSALGIYNIGYELSSIPTTEIVAPINRAVWPGYAKMMSDPIMLRSSFMAVLSLVALIVVPSGVGIAILAQPFVGVLLGERWAEAVPVVQVLALNGVLFAFITSARDLLMASGRMVTLFRLVLLQGLLLLSALLVGARADGVVGAAWGVLAVSVALIPLFYFSVTRLIEPRHRDFASLAWRPVAGAIVMTLTVDQWLQILAEFAPHGAQIVPLLSSIALGAIVYALSVLFLWWVSGAPDGAENLLLKELRARLRRSASNPNAV